MTFALELFLIFIASALGVMGGLAIGTIAARSRRRREVNRTVQELLDSYGIEHSEEVPSPGSRVQ